MKSSTARKENLTRRLDDKVTRREGREGNVTLERVIFRKAKEKGGLSEVSKLGDRR